MKQFSKSTYVRLTALLVGGAALLYAAGAPVGGKR